MEVSTDVAFLVKASVVYIDYEFLHTVYVIVFFPSLDEGRGAGGKGA